MSWSSIQGLEYLLHIVLAVVCGGTTDFERGRHSKSTGIHTHIIMVLSATLVMVVSKCGFFGVIDLRGVSLDASRAATGVVTAIDFLDVGVISTHERTVNGVTIAAGLWAAVGIGIAVGAGLYVIGGVVTMLIILFQVILHRLFPLIKTQCMGTVILELSEVESDPAEAYRLLEGRILTVERMRVACPADGRVEVKCDVLFPARRTTENILRALKGMPATRSVEMYHPG